MLTATKAHEYYVIASGQQGKIEGEVLLFYGGGGPYAEEPTEEARTRLLSERVYEIYGEGRQAWEQANRPEKSN
jgi:hypothetical protein